MNCREVRERLIEYVDGLLEGSQLQVIEEHLQICPDCRSELESMRELDAGLKREVPAMWESIEPSPAFLNRLKSMELEPQRASVWGFLDPVMLLFQNHRPLAAAGLTVLIAVVLALTIPGIISEDGGGESEMVAEAPSLTAPVEESHDLDFRAPGGVVIQDEAQSKGVDGGEEAVPPPATTGLNGTYFSWGTEEIKSPEPTPAPVPPPVPMETPMPRPTTLPSAECTEASVAFYDDLACGGNPTAEIALAHPEVQGALDGRTITSIQILQDVDEEGYVCSGSTVSIATDETEPHSPLLYVCVESGSVTFIKIFPAE